MSFTQQTFLGASIRYFRGSLGWGDNPSTLNVGLVEDPANGDEFFVPGVGVPVLFQYSDWSFGGIIQSWSKDFSTSGHPLYEVILVDPREILSGVQLILSGYSDTVYGVANLINVFGYHEDVYEFGGAEVNSAGIPWQKVRDAVILMTQVGSTSTYGGPVSLGGYIYSLDLWGLPALPSYFRVPAQAMSLMEYIKFVCDAANVDYFFTLTPSSIGGTISLVTISRNILPVPGAIDRFISSNGGSVTKSAGYELRNETTSKFIIGGPVSEMYIQSTGPNAAGGDGDFETNPEQNSVWPYWGEDYDQNTIIGDGLDNDHQFSLPTKGLNVFGVGDYYPTDIGELRAAYEGFDSWSSYLCLHNQNRYVNKDFENYLYPGRYTRTDYFYDFIEERYVTDAAGKRVEYHHNNRLNPHYGKAHYLNITGLLPRNLVGRIAKMDKGELIALTADTFMSYLDPGNISTYSNIRMPNSPETDTENKEMLFQFVSGYARSYYGQKFMIRMPFIESAEVPESNNIIISRQPVEAGFIDEDTWESAIRNNYLPGNIDRMLDGQFKIKAYARYNNIRNLDFSGIEESNITLSDDGNTAFVLCEISNDISYQDYDTKFSPRAVVTLPGAVYPISGPNTGNHLGVIIDTLVGIMIARDNRRGGTMTRQEVNEKISKLLTTIGATNLNFGFAPMFVMPDIFVVPLQSNISRYGPWYATGANGKLELEIDDNLVPWSFGGYDEMNQAAEAKVTSAISRYQAHEAGSIEYPGVPTVHMGEALVASGPYVTDINVSIGTEGAKTTYNMGTWTPQPFRFRKAQSEYISRVNKKNQELRQQFRQYIRANDKVTTILANRVNNTIKGLQKSARKKKSSPHMNICGYLQPMEVELEDGNTRTEYKHVVAMDTDYGFSSSLAGYYDVTGGGTLDTLFVPFSTNYNAEGIPHFQEPSDPSGLPNGSSLNPFQKGSNFGAMVRDEAIPEEGLGFVEDSQFRDIRGIALRSPMVLAGWGYDTNDKPVPNSGTADGSDELSDSFHQDYLTRKDLWKCGPVDMRWDDDKGMWIAGTSATKLVRINSDSSASGIDNEVYPFRHIVPRVYKATVMEIQPYDRDEREDGVQPYDGQRVRLASIGEEILVTSIHKAFVANGTIELAFRFGGHWLIGTENLFGVGT